ncbi:PqqD family protein [bacterium]|nr:PqqD family protein [bacterium]
MLKFKQNDDIAYRVIDGEAVLLNPVNNEIHQLNETGTFMWEQHAEPQTQETLAAAVCNEFEVDYERAIKDVEMFTRDLLNKGLIECMEDAEE